MQTSSTSPRPLSPFQNPHAMTQGQGNAIDWAKVSAYFYNIGKFIVKLSGAAAVGDETLDVDALEYPLPKGTVLDFGQYDPVTVTVADADVNATETTIGVVALTGPIPNGTILQFSGAGAGFAKLTAAAVAGATSLTVEALPEDIDDAATAEFPGGAQNAELVEDAEAGAIELIVEPLSLAIANDAEALADSTGTNDKRKIPMGTVMVKDATSGLLVPRRDRGASEEAIGFLASDADENSRSDAKSGYGIVIGNTTIWENLCPDSDSAGDLPAAYKTELKANGVGFVFEDWSDTRIA